MLLLASGSPARRRLLQQARIPFRWQVSGVDEDSQQASNPSELVRALAARKAEAVAEASGLGDWCGGEGLAASAVRPREPGIGAILGCDSLLLHGGMTYGKPASAAEAQARWRRLSGERASLLSGHCLLSRMGRRLEVVATTVVFARLSELEIGAYVASGEPLACAGGFALEGLGGLVVERIEGCWSNVIGLSLPLLRRWLTELGASPLAAEPAGWTSAQATAAQAGVGLS